MTARTSHRRRVVILGLAVGALALAAVDRARAEAQLLIEASTGKVLHAENATYPWYPASVTKLMTAYTTLRAIKEGGLSLNTLLPISRNAVGAPSVTARSKIAPGASAAPSARAARARATGAADAL